ncbi:MAG: DUF362 domain-containing protein, partial [Ignavibacteriaceae bacterium]|nr:DUF362 domain-containing protein [Ignavibacteriaceae bacterium]
PHYLIGSPENGGDQFPIASRKSNLENKLVIAAKKMMLKNRPSFFFIARKLKKVAYKIFGQTEKVVRSGNWYGNNTVWRMCLDLNRVLMYCNPDGTLRTTPKKMISIVDGFSAMEGNGPVAGTLNPAGVILCGDNPVSVDAACAKIMGLDYNKISIIKRAFDDHKYPLSAENYSEIIIRSNNKKWDKRLNEIKFEDSLKFKPHFGWAGHIEEQ